MASGTLYTYANNHRAFKALIAAEYGGGSVVVDPKFVFGETNETPAFLKKFPTGKVPAFEDKKGQCVWESNAIAWYVGSPELRGKNDLEQAQVIQWLNYSDSEVGQAVSIWVFPYLGIIDFNKQSVTNAKNELKTILKHVNDFLLSRTYLVGERVTLADIVLACTLLPAYKTVLDANFRKEFQNVNRWFTTIINQPKVKKILGEVKFCEKEPEVPKKDQGGKAKDGKKEEKKEKKPQQPKAKEQPPPAEPAEELDEADLILQAEPKSKDPFEALPKGTFNFDDFKRVYSNEDTNVSVPYFWEKFDAENYSIWFGSYKYNDELKKVFMSCNLITGMFQRLDKMRKNAFASVCLFGKDDDNTISGVWIWRGQGLAFELSPDWQVDYESYAWTKLDPKNADHMKLVNNYLEWTGKDQGGRDFNQGKIFK